MCNVARVLGDAQRTLIPSPPHIFDKSKINIVKIFLEYNHNGALSEYLAELAHTASLEKLVKHARLKKDLYYKRDTLERMTGEYFKLLAVVTMRRFMDDILDDASDPVAWDNYVAERPALQQRLKELNVDVAEAGALLATIYNTVEMHDYMSTDQQAAGSTLYIGRPLDQEQRMVMACLCDDAHVSYEFVPDVYVNERAFCRLLVAATRVLAGDCRSGFAHGRGHQTGLRFDEDE